VINPSATKRDLELRIIGVIFLKQDKAPNRENTHIQNLIIKHFVIRIKKLMFFNNLCIFPTRGTNIIQKRIRKIQVAVRQGNKLAGDNFMKVPLE
jgi:hypothetical protein